MSFLPFHPRTLEKLSLLPPEHPRRRAFVATLSRLSPSTQSEWLALVRDTELLRASLHRGTAPADLEATLLRLPDQAAITMARAPRRGSWASMQIPWQLVAAVLLVMAGLGGYLFWHNNRPRVVASLAALPQGAVDEITLLAVNNRINALPLEVESSDREVVRAALQAEVGKEMRFAVIVPAPASTYQLLGGRVCAFGGAKAIETRWRRKDQVYTLFQFSPADFAMPKEFSVLRESPPKQQAAMEKYAVAIWPGGSDGSCTWAVVSERNGAPEPFTTGAY